MSRSVVSLPAADADIDAAFEWYERERPGLGAQFAAGLRQTYARIAQKPAKYAEMNS